MAAVMFFSCKPAGSVEMLILGRLLAGLSAAFLGTVIWLVKPSFWGLPWIQDCNVAFTLTPYCEWLSLPFSIHIYPTPFWLGGILWGSIDSSPCKEVQLGLFLDS
ncbi:unnamed protein product [Acanthoscelides obtectus]|uniref:Uncharacterized protein n=1 Tax=Acanthoscelides obtectus TaxID=200917 RepID=A0A9P0QEA7_ACAOB|nr:unnamed protein product [Acanthoscelides obtectus]CAK1624408.1 hypothetical protein AOBTE_LOCUS2555 [Acanthoscelides obtectus]